MIQSADMESEQVSQQLRDLTTRFEKAWEAARAVEAAPDPSAFLPKSGDATRAVILQQLIAIDLKFRWQHQTPAYLEQYLARFPELGGSESLPPRLIHEEYRLRHCHGDKPRIGSYEERFPAQYAAVEKLGLAVLQPTLASPSPQPAKAAGDVIPTLQSPAPWSPDGLAKDVPNLNTVPPPSTIRRPRPSGREDILPIAGGYRLLKRLGRGSFGEVWRAQAPGDVDVAVKLISRPLDDETSQRELHSLEVIKQLRHPYLLSTQAFWSHEDQLIIAMELADGSLSDRLKECQNAGLQGIPVEELLAYFREAAEALDFLHGQGVQHRDIKPDNLLLLQHHIKVADFGLVRLQENLRLTAATFCGTPAFMAPEVWLGKISPHSDQYSLAMTYAELRLGHVLFASPDLPGLMKQHLDDMPDLAPLPETERTVLLKALAKDPAQRYSNCVAFLQALVAAAAPPLASQLINSIPGQDGTSASAIKTATSAKRRKLLWFTAFLASITVIALALFFTSKPPYLPAGFHRVNNDTVTDKHGHKYWRQIATELPGVDETIEFIAMPQLDSQDPETFYIMKNKVSVGLFKQFATNKPEKVTWDKWNKDADAHFPVLGVAVDDAQSFAFQWPSGNLPSVDQWDRAAGFYSDKPEKWQGEGPYKGSWDAKPQIALTEPMRVGEALADESPFGCRDMAGNGQEWTGTQFPGKQRLPPADLKQEVEVVLRGKSCFQKNDPEPLSYEALQKQKVGSWSNRVPPPQGISFRVVLEPPQG